jgi:hypothetical protein
LYLTQAVPFTASQLVDELFNLGHSGASSWFASLLASEGLNLGTLCPLSNGLGKTGKGHGLGIGAGAGTGVVII